MEALFLKVINMSITAAYIIPAVIFIRFLLRRAPKKYSYLLWSVVLFRLICPVSFSAVFSIFQTKLFDMTTAQRDGGAVLNFVPANIGYMETPGLTVGIPAMNSVISESLPAAAPYASVNPLQIWIFLGTVLWCAGIAILLVCSIISYVRLECRMATAVRLEGNVFESDKIRSPFILGLVSPRIYIPFGLGEREQSYILRHERYHLKRKDHLIKPLSFFILAIHWFNPFVWLAFTLMAKDMEMSCDERVLSETGVDIVQDYSISLLAFASNRRFPAACPLAFGESGIRARVKNILRFKAQKRWVIVLAFILCAASVAACAANPVSKAAAVTNDIPSGNYVFEKQLYMNPLSSFIAFDGYQEYYTITDDMLVLTDVSGNQQKITGILEKDDLDKQEFQNSFDINIGVPDIAAFQKRYLYTLTNTSGSMVYRIYQLDDEIWLARMTSGGKKHWSIYKITKFEGQIPMKVIVSGTQDGVENFLSLQQGFNSGYNKDTCYNITPDDIKENTDYSVFKYDTSCASFLLYEDKIYPLGAGFGGYGLTSMALADLNGDEMQELYFTYSFGSGLHRSHAAYFDPVAKKVVTFDYIHFNKDMMVTDNGNGGLALYSASISNLMSFVYFEIEKKDFIANIVEQKGEVSLEL